MKQKNPLYVIKGKDVHEASGIVDLVIKKFNLEPVIKFLGTILKMLLEQVKTYPTFLAVKTIIDEVLEKYLGFFLKKASPA